MMGIEKVREALKLFEIEVNAIGWNDTRVEQFKEAIKILKQAITELERLQKKETPMETKYYDEDYMFGKSGTHHCGVCGKKVAPEIGHKYCPYCGQKIEE